VGPGAAGHTPGQSYSPLDEFHLQGLGVVGEAGAVVVVSALVLVNVVVGVAVGAAVGVPGTPTQTKTST
jgi:hypothetical protein